MTWELIGHQWAVNLLKKHINSGQVRHAYMICGEEGIGKRTLAVEFARALNCANEGKRGGYCGECRPCTLIPIDAFPDFHVLEPEDDSASLKVDQVRELQQQLALSPYESRWRIALIPDFEKATDNAANALLKTLEEPSTNVVVILTATDAAALLPTIVSRCDQITLRAVSRDELVEAIADRGLPELDVQLIAGIAQGRPGSALRYADDPKMLEARNEQIDKLASLIQSSRGERFDYVESLLPRKDDLDRQRQRVRDVLRTWMGIWRDAMQRCFSPGVDIVNRDWDMLIEKLVDEVGSDQIQECVHAIQRTQRAIDRFANIRLAMEVLMLDLPYL